MLKRIMMAITALVVIFVAYSIIFRETPIKNQDSTGTGIVAFGDSLIYGVGSTKDNDLISLLSARIGMPIKNLGISGNTTADGLARIDAALKQKPRLVILLLGGNDYLRRIPSEDTFKNLSTLIEKMQASGSMVLLLGVRGGLITDTFDDKFKSLAKKYQTGFVSNVLSGLIGREEYMYDAVHPNNAGYLKIAERVEPELKRMLGVR